MKRMLLLFVVISVMLIGCGGKGKSTDPAGPNVQVPVLTTAAVSGITPTTAWSGGTITSDGGATVTARGVCWSTNQTPTIADSKAADSTRTGNFISLISGLTTSTRYYVRAYATNSAGTGYGSAIPFTTLSSNVISDIDGNIYQTVTIGTQVWMVQNLKATHYRNGDVIPNVIDSTMWHDRFTGAYCNYANSEANGAVYGRLYNWYAVNDGRNITPAGWHVPSDAEWQTLVDYLGGGTIAGGAMKETGTVHWYPPNTGATNESGFTALPGGFRLTDCYCNSVRWIADFWSSTADNSFSAWALSIYSDNGGIARGADGMDFGYSVRCIRD